MDNERRFPPPWTVERLNEDAFVVKDANGLTSANLVKTSGYATGFKVPWFGDYSLRCERCGRKVWLDQAPVLKLRVTAASYSCECGEVWGAFLNTVPMRAHWLRCEERERVVWPWKIDLLKKMDGPPPIRLIQ